MYPYFDYMSYCEREAEKMYPEICQDLYPHIRRVCVKKDRIYNQNMYPFPQKEDIEKMVDEVCEMYAKEKMYRSPDGYGPGGLFRSLIWVLLLGELLGRRRRGYPGYGYPGYGYPGQEYPGYGY